MANNLPFYAFSGTFYFVIAVLWSATTMAVGWVGRALFALVFLGTMALSYFHPEAKAWDRILFVVSTFVYIYSFLFFVSYEFENDKGGAQ